MPAQHLLPCRTCHTYMLFTGWEVRIEKNCDRGLNMLTEASGLRSAYQAEVTVFPYTDRPSAGK